MWIDFNGTLIKVEDILYVNKGTTSSYGETILTLTVKTKHIEITQKYSTRNQLKRREDYQKLFDILKNTKEG